MFSYYVVEAANHGTDREHEAGTWEPTYLFKCEHGLFHSLLGVFEEWIKPKCDDMRETRFRRVSKSDARHYHKVHGLFLCKHEHYKKAA